MYLYHVINISPDGTMSRGGGRVFLRVKDNRTYNKYDYLLEACVESSSGFTGRRTGCYSEQILRLLRLRRLRTGRRPVLLAFAWSARHPERSAQRGVEGSRAATAERLPVGTARDPTNTLTLAQTTCADRANACRGQNRASGLISARPVAANRGNPWSRTGVLSFFPSKSVPKADLVHDGFNHL